MAAAAIIPGKHQERPGAAGYGNLGWIAQGALPQVVEMWLCESLTSKQLSCTAACFLMSKQVF